jgi:hypothetical protein
MASVSLIEGLAKKFINMVPRPFYTEAAQKLVHEICETVYKDLETEENKKYPRVEIIDIVEKFVKTHLENTDTETPSGIRKAIEDNLAKTTLEVYKDEKINMLLLQSILSEEVGPDGIFYKSLEQSINITNNPDSNNSGGVDNKKDKNDDSNKEKKDTDKDSEKFAKKVVNELVNTNVEIAQSEQPDSLNVDTNDTNDTNHTNDTNDKNDTNDTTNQNGGWEKIKNPYDKIMDAATNTVTDFAGKNPLTAAAGMAVGAALLNGTRNKSGSGNGNQPQITNIGYEPNKNGALPYIQTNCNGSGLGLPSIDLNFLSQFLDGLKEPIAEELVKKIQERLSDKTTDSLTVKSEIYEKILLVIQAHLQSKEGKDMLLGHINELIKKEVDILTTNNEIKKRLLKVIFKNKNSEIYKKLIEIIALHSSQIGVAQPLPPDATSTLPPAATSTSPPDAAELKPLQNGGKESKKFHVDTIEIVIQEFSTWLNEKIGPTPQPVNETDAEAETIVGSSAPPVEAKAEVIEPSNPPLADVVMVNSDGKGTSNSTSVEAEPVTSNNDNPAENVGTKNVDNIAHTKIMQDIMIKNYEYNLFGKYDIEENTGKIYKFTKVDDEMSSSCVPESDITKVNGFNSNHIQLQKNLNNKEYNLHGDYNVEVYTGTFYKFTNNKGKLVFVPESDIEDVEVIGFKNLKELLNKKGIMPTSSTASNEKKTTELKPITGSNTSNSPIDSKSIIPPIGSNKMKKQHDPEDYMGNPYRGPNAITGGNPTKNKTKKRRTKNNKRKTSKTLKNKQKRRVTKKKNRKHNHKK